MVRACVLEDMTAAERGQLHARAAALLRDAGLRADVLAPHLLATEPAADAEVVRLLRAAAAPGAAPRRAGPGPRLPAPRAARTARRRPSWPAC